MKFWIWIGLLITAVVGCIIMAVIEGDHETSDCHKRKGHYVSQRYNSFCVSNDGRIVKVY